MPQIRPLADTVHQRCTIAHGSGTRVHPWVGLDWVGLTPILPATVSVTRFCAAAGEEEAPARQQTSVKRWRHTGAVQPFIQLVSEPYFFTVIFWQMDKSSGCKGSLQLAGILPPRNFVSARMWFCDFLAYFYTCVTSLTSKSFVKAIFQILSVKIINICREEIWRQHSSVPNSIVRSLRWDKLQDNLFAVAVLG